MKKIFYQAYKDEDGHMEGLISVQSEKGFEKSKLEKKAKRMGLKLFGKPFQAH